MEQPTAYFLKRDDPEFDIAFKALAAKGYDVGKADDRSPAWQYMGTFLQSGGFYLHQFRQRGYNGPNRYEYIPVSR